VKFDVDRALKVWEKKYPERGERIEVLRGMLYDCEDTEGRSRNGHVRTYPETARSLRLMLAAEGAERS